PRWGPVHWQTSWQKVWQIWGGRLPTFTQPRFATMRPPQRSTVIFWGLLASLAIATVVRVDIRSQAADLHVDGGAAAAAESSALIVRLPHAAENGTRDPLAPWAITATVPAPLAIQHHIADTLGRDGSIYLTLKSHGVPEVEIARVGQALARVFNAQRETHPGDAILMTLDSLKTVLRFAYSPSRDPEYPVFIERVGEELQARRDSIQLTDRTWAIEVVIEDNLSNAISAAGEGDALTDLVVDYAFGSVIDFHRDVRRGDRLGLVFTRSYLGDRFVRYGQVLLARYEGQVESHLAVQYRDPMGQEDYYEADGASLERMFLLKPMVFRRISSRFTRQRFHPILKRNVPHLGTDYAAATGTDVWATAQGRVTVAGWNGGYGKMVELEHPNGYRTRYAHLSRIVVRKGQRVSQRDVVGQVGATGRATGPHLHYELIHNGSQIDPRSVNRGDEARALAPAYREAFEQRKRYLVGLLDDTRRTPPSVIADAAHRRPAALSTP
ncbi:MAG: peptidoglycan DD-metalloendopeptidase family protein, partial [bacterium]|nr:peptidoglycan DD-metalloendopeptidase family protein [bacterium]